MPAPFKVFFLLRVHPICVRQPEQRSTKSPKFPVSINEFHACHPHPPIFSFSFPVGNICIPSSNRDATFHRGTNSPFPAPSFYIRILCVFSIFKFSFSCLNANFADGKSNFGFCARMYRAKRVTRWERIIRIQVNGMLVLGLTLIGSFLTEFNCPCKLS